MKISELIEKLQELQNVHGDLEVLLYEQEWNVDNDLDEINHINDRRGNYIQLM